MAAINKKLTLARRRKFKEAWKDRIYLVKGGLRKNLTTVQPQYIAATPAALEVCIYSLLAKQYAKQSGLTPPQFIYLMAAVTTREITGRLTFKSDTPLVAKFNRTALKQLQDKLILIQTHVTAGAHGNHPPTPARPGKKIKGSYYYYTVSPLGISIAADFTHLCNEFMQHLRDNPESTPDPQNFIKTYFLRQSGKL